MPNYLLDYAKSHNFQRVGSEWHGPCPWCGGDDRFFIVPSSNRGRGGSGTYACRDDSMRAGKKSGSGGHGCGRKGDGVSFLIDWHKWSISDAKAAYGILDDNRPLRARPPALRSGKKRAETVLRKTTVKDVLAWRSAASALLQEVQQAMRPGTAGWKYAEQRGLTPASIKRYRLGYLSGRRAPKCAEWGIDKRDDDGKPMDTFWISQGLVIPGFDNAGSIVKLKIRQVWPEAKLRYLSVSGSAQTLAIVENNRLPLVFVEGEIDALLIHQDLGGAVSALAMGGTSLHVDKYAAAYLKAAPVVLEAFDNDDGGDSHRQHLADILKNLGLHPAVHLDIPGGHKDPGDARAHGHDLRAWITQALPCLTISTGAASVVQSQRPAAVSAADMRARADALMATVDLSDVADIEDGDGAASAPAAHVPTAQPTAGTQAAVQSAPNGPEAARPESKGPDMVFLNHGAGQTVQEIRQRETAQPEPAPPAMPFPVRCAQGIIEDPTWKDIAHYEGFRRCGECSCLSRRNPDGSRTIYGQGTCTKDGRLVRFKDRCHFEEDRRST